MQPTIEQRIAKELNARAAQVEAAVKLLDEGATVPFIARYRKEVTGGLTDDQLRELEERLRYLRELEERRATVLASIEEQGKMTPALKIQIKEAEDKSRLEDLYLPFKPKRRTKAQIAIEAGLEPLANALLKDPTLDPENEAKKFLRDAFTGATGDNPGVPDTKTALDGARAILIERFAEDADLIQEVRTHLIKFGVVDAEKNESAKDPELKYQDYYKYAEPLVEIPSHRALAIMRGEREGVLALKLRLQGEKERPKTDAPHNMCEQSVDKRYHIADKKRPADKWLLDTVRLAWRTKLSLHVETDLMGKLREHAETEAIAVFARNCKELLLAAPAGHKVTLGLDPGLRTGVKVAVVDATGKVLEHATIYPHVPHNDKAGAMKTLSALVKKYGVTLIAIGNGTASRETDALAKDLVSAMPESKLVTAVVSEAGASVYSASAFAAKELPKLDVSIRGAVSIARRLQDPLAELVKIDPKSIGVGQYQHDVNQGDLARSLDAVVEDCVNAVGVDVNTASAPLLARVSGINATVAANIVAYRDEHGMFAKRTQLTKVPRLGDKAFEQAAGFLRIMNGDDPLDASAVHPESYKVVERIAKDTERKVAELIGDGALLRSLDPKKYADEHFGIPTVTDILHELEKPGRDPRPQFETAKFREGVNDIKDLKIGMLLEGVVTNVAAFGAFVDIGVHQDGLVHISALAEKFVKDPHTVVKVGQVVKVKVLEADPLRKRVALTMKNLDAE